MTHFEKYQKLIQKQAWKYAKKWGVDYDDMVSEGYLIYCQTLKSWKPEKGSFTTHLYFALMNLNTYGKDMYRQEHVRDNLNPLDFIINDVHYDSDWLNEFKKELSVPAYNLLLWILSYEWHGKMKKIKKLPTISQSAKHFNSTSFKIKKYWEELKEVWRKKENYFSETL